MRAEWDDQSSEEVKEHLPELVIIEEDFHERAWDSSWDSSVPTLSDEHQFLLKELQNIIEDKVESQSQSSLRSNQPHRGEIGDLYQENERLEEKVHQLEQEKERLQEQLKKEKATDNNISVDEIQIPSSKEMREFTYSIIFSSVFLLLAGLLALSQGLIGSRLLAAVAAILIFIIIASFLFQRNIDVPE